MVAAVITATAPIAITPVWTNDLDPRLSGLWIGSDPGS
jgi:hypothetical protein